MLDFIRRWFRPKNPGSEPVPFYDFATEKLVYIPKEELSGQAVWVKIEGWSHPVYVDGTELKASPFQHETLDEKTMEAIRVLERQLADVYPLTIDQWVDGFRRDRGPEGEVALWLHLANVLHRLSAQFAFSAAERKECFRLLLVCSNGERSTVRERSEIRLLTVEQIDLAIRWYYEGGNPPLAPSNEGEPPAA